MGAGGSRQFQNAEFASLRLGKYKLFYLEKGKSWPVLKNYVTRLYKLNTFNYKKFGFRRGVVEAFALLGCYAASIGSSFPTFRNSLSAPSLWEGLRSGCFLGQTMIPIQLIP